MSAPFAVGDRVRTDRTLCQWGEGFEVPAGSEGTVTDVARTYRGPFAYTTVTVRWDADDLDDTEVGNAHLLLERTSAKK